MCPIFFQSSWNCWFNWFLVSKRFILFSLSIVGEKYFQLHYLYSTKNLLCSQIWISRSFTYMYQITLLLCSIVTVLYNGKITVKCTLVFVVLFCSLLYMNAPILYWKTFNHFFPSPIWTITLCHDIPINNLHDHHFFFLLIIFPAACRSLM